MKKVLLILVGLVAAAVLGVVGMAMTKADIIEVKRSVVVQATPVDIAPHLHDFNKFVQWSPWSDLDPNQTTTISEPSQGVGARYEWSGNDEVGVGHMTNTMVSDARIEQNLVFVSPWESNASVYYNLVAQGDKTEITWGFTEPADAMGKVMQVFIDMDDMLGPQYEKGLATLGPIVEKAAQDRLAEEKAAAEKLAEAEPEAAE